MTLRIISAVALLVAVADPAAGQTDEEYKGIYVPPSPLKVETPNSLGVDYYHDDECPGTRADMNSIIDGLFVRSRLKRGI